LWPPRPGVLLLAMTPHPAHRPPHLASAIRLLAGLTLAATACATRPVPILDRQALLERHDWWDNRDWDWYAAKIPFFESPDPIDATYYYRWEVLTKHLTYGSPETGYTFTEFIDRPVLVRRLRRHQLPARPPALRGALAQGPPRSSRTSPATGSRRRGPSRAATATGTATPCGPPTSRSAGPSELRDGAAAHGDAVRGVDRGALGLGARDVPSGTACTTAWSSTSTAGSPTTIPRRRGLPAHAQQLPVRGRPRHRATPPPCSANRPRPSSTPSARRP
jgi:hypothetical protein